MGAAVSAPPAPERTFFASEPGPEAPHTPQTPIELSPALLQGLIGPGPPSASESQAQSKAEQLRTAAQIDAHVRHRIAARLAELQASEDDLRRTVEAQLKREEAETQERVVGSGGVPGLMREVEQLKERVGRIADRRPSDELPSVSNVRLARQRVLQCYRYVLCVPPGGYM